MNSKVALAAILETSLTDMKRNGMVDRAASNAIAMSVLVAITLDEEGCACETQKNEALISPISFLASPKSGLKWPD